jgi:hypothetical protein
VEGVSDGEDAEIEIGGSDKDAEEIEGDEESATAETEALLGTLLDATLGTGLGLADAIGFSKLFLKTPKKPDQLIANACDGRATAATAMAGPPQRLPS